MLVLIVARLLAAQSPEPTNCPYLGKINVRIVTPAGICTVADSRFESMTYWTGDGGAVWGNISCWAARLLRCVFFECRCSGMGGACYFRCLDKLSELFRLSASKCEAGALGHFFFILKADWMQYIPWNQSTVLGCSPNLTGRGSCAFYAGGDFGTILADLNFTACLSSNGTSAMHFYDYSYVPGLKRLTVSCCLGRDVMSIGCFANWFLNLSYSNLYLNTVVRGSVPPNVVPWTPKDNPYQYGVLVSSTEGISIRNCVFLGNHFDETRTGYVLYDVLPILNGSKINGFGGPFLIFDSYLTYDKSRGAAYFSVTRPVQVAPTMPHPCASTCFSASSRAAWTRLPQSGVPDKGSAVYDGTEYLESGLGDRESVSLPKSGSVVRSGHLKDSSHFEKTFVASRAFTLSSILRFSVECPVSSVYDGTTYLESSLGDRKSVALTESGSFMRSCNLDADRGSAGLTASVEFVISSAFVSGYLIRSEKLRETASPTWAFDSGDRAKLSSGAIAGIVLGILALLAVVVLIIYLNMKSGSNSISQRSDTSSEGITTQSGWNELATAEWVEHQWSAELEGNFDLFMNSVEHEPPQE
jgi:hypothetical protein